MVACIVETEDCVSPLIMALLYMKGLPTHISPPLCETCLYFTEKRSCHLARRLRGFSTVGSVIPYCYYKLLKACTWRTLTFWA